VLPARLTVTVGGEAGITRQLRLADRRAELLELGVRADGQVQEAVGGGVGAIWSDRRVLVALPRGRLAGREVAPALVGQERHHRVLHGHVDKGALALALAGVERRADGVGAEHAGRDVADRHPQLDRGAVGQAGDAHQAGSALHDLVVTGQRGAVLAEAADRAVDQPRVEAFQVLVAQAQAGGGARPQVLDEHVAGRGPPLI